MWYIEIVKKFKSPKNMHVFAIAIACISVFCLYVYAHTYVKNTFINKLALKRLDTDIGSVSLGSSIVFKDVNITFKNSEITIKSIKSNYLLNNIVINKAHLSGKVEDYLSLHSSGSNSSNASDPGNGRKIIFNDCFADLSFRGKKASAENVYFSNVNNVITAKRAMVDRLIMTGVKYSLSSNTADIDKLQVLHKVVKTGSGITSKPSVQDFNIPTLPDVQYEINIKQLGDPESLFDIRAKNVCIHINSGKFLSIRVSGDSFRYIDDELKADQFSFKASGSVSNKANVNYYIDVSNVLIRNEKLSSDDVLIPDIVVYGNLEGNPVSFKVTDGHLRLLKDVHIKYSFKYSGELINYNIELVKTSCSDFMEQNPFKDIFECTKPVCEKRVSTDFFGDFEFSINSDNDPIFQFESSCDFHNVPWYMKPQRFKSSFSIPVGESESKYKPRKEVLLGPGTNKWVPGNLISFYMEKALSVTEDGRFYSHRGIDPRAVSALIHEAIETGSFTRGGSTITMQLAKNLWLTREKTLNRKVQEFFLTLYIESVMSKSEIMELYLNVIEFGPNVYGIRDASQYYFKKTPIDLTLKESMFLASILPNPTLNYFSSGTVINNAKLNFLIKELYKRDIISETEMNEGIQENIYKK